MHPEPSPTPKGSHLKPRHGRATLLAGLGLIGILFTLATGCAKEEVASSGDAGTVDIVLTDEGCSPSPARVEAGETTFHVTNDGANGVSEAELKAGDGQSILGERENITPGLSKDFSLSLAEGTYRVYCPGAKQDTWTFNVKGGEKVPDWRSNPALVTAVKGYADYVNTQADELVPKVKAFADAVHSGDVAAAKAAYIQARIPYERIEPVAESFGELDPKIDGRLGDNGNAPEDFIGFHRIEKALWVDDSLDGMAPVADQLVTDVEELRDVIADKASSYDPNEVTNGARELMEEVLTSKITGEEERYAHIDLVDFQANFDGSMQTIDLLRPVLTKSAPELLKRIDEAAENAQAALDEFAADPGYEHTGFIEWSCARDESGELPEGCRVNDKTKVTNAQRRDLTDAVTPLATLLSEVPVKVVR